MRCYLIAASSVTVCAREPKSQPTDAIVIRTAKDLDQKRFAVPRLIAIWNGLPGAEPVRRFRSRPIAVKKLWAAFERLPLTTGRTKSKQARLIALLQRPSGATMDDLVRATGWQSHSIRGLLSGVVRKKLRLPLSLVKEGDRCVYRIAG
jgi:hypothetical protein